jgi:sorting nexin-1/2
MKVVVTGASGLLGRAVHAHFAARSHEVLALANSRAAGTSNLVQLDLLDTDAFATLLHDFAPDVIVHTAAERRPDVVERDPDRCHTLNAEVPGRIASICKEAGKQTRLIYISTDYVFDGSRPPYQVDSEPNPLNAYGTSKLLGERAVAEHGQAGKTTSLRVPVL